MHTERSVIDCAGRRVSTRNGLVIFGHRDPAPTAALRTQAVEDGDDFIYADIACLPFLRAVPGQPVGRRGDRGSLAKLAWAHCDQELANLTVDLIGPEALGYRWGDRRGDVGDQRQHRGRARARAAPVIPPQDSLARGACTG